MLSNQVDILQKKTSSGLKMRQFGLIFLSFQLPHWSCASLKILVSLLLRILYTYVGFFPSCQRSQKRGMWWWSQHTTDYPALIPQPVPELKPSFVPPLSEPQGSVCMLTPYISMCCLLVLTAAQPRPLRLLCTLLFIHWFLLWVFPGELCLFSS